MNIFSNEWLSASSNTATQSQYWVFGWLTVAWLTVGLACPGCAGAIELVKQGQPTGVIVIGEPALPSVERAAWELQYHVKEASGATLEIVRENKLPSAQRNCVYLGTTQAAQRARINPADLGRNGFAIKTVGSNLFIVGRDEPGEWNGEEKQVESGTLFGVYELLETEMQVRWLWPGKLGEVIPKRSTIKITKQDRAVTLPLAHARVRTHTALTAGLEGWASREVHDRFLEDQRIWLRRHRFSWDGSFDAAHAFTRHWRRLGESHPEYFNMLPDGTRRPDPYHYSGMGTLVSMCVSNPALWQLIVDEHGTNGAIDMSENDTPGKCVCPQCMAWDVPVPLPEGVGWDQRADFAKQAYIEGDGNWWRYLGSLSDRYGRFCLAVQELAQQENPDTVVQGLIYGNYSEPPAEVKLNRRVVLAFVAPVGYPWTDAACKRMREYWDGWASSGAGMLLRPNFMLDGHCMPIYFAHKFRQEFSHAFQNGMVATDFDSLTGQYGTQGHNLYMLARLNRYGDLSAAQVIAEYNQAFGPAKDAVIEYFDHWREVSDSVTEAPADWATFYDGAEKVFTPSVMAKGRALMTKAQEAAQGDPTAVARMDFLEKGLRQAEMVLATQAAYSKYREGGNIAPFAAQLAQLDAYRAQVEDRYISNMTFLAARETALWERALVKMLNTPGEDLPLVWKFIWDPENVGEEEGWHGAEFDETSWHDIRTDTWWEKQPVGKAWQAEHGSPYNGLAWYRVRFDVKTPDQPMQYRLGFGSVDEACIVWLNGKRLLVRSYPYQGDKDSWKKAFEIDVSDVIRFDKPNVLAVRVEDNAGAGGIWRPVRLLFSPLQSGEE